MVVAVLVELAEALGRFPALRCRPQVEMDDGCVVLTVRVPAAEQGSLEGELQVVELFNDLHHVADMAQLRGLATRYGIEPERLEALLHKKGE